MNLKLKTIITRTLAGIAAVSLGMGSLSAQAQQAGSHVKVGTWNNSKTEGYVHGNGRAYSRQMGGVHIEGGGNSNARPCKNCGDAGGHGGYGFRGGYEFQRGAGIRGTGSFGLNETTHFGAEGSSWTQFQW